MSNMSLEWTGPAGPAALTLLAGPWRRGAATADDTAEVFRLRVPGDHATPTTPDPRRVLASASERLLAVLTHDPSDAPRSATELQRALASDSGMSMDISPLLAELTRRGVGLARVDSELGRHHCVSTEISASGQITTHILAAAPAELLTLHREAVAAALQTRATLLRAALTTTELAALIAAFASPAAVGLALPLAWHFLHTLLSEHRTSSPGE